MEDKAPVVADKAPVVADKAPIVTDKHKVDVVMLSNVVVDKPINVVVADNADVGKASVKDKDEVCFLKGSLSVDDVFDIVQDDPTKVVKENVLAVVNDKASDALKNKLAYIKEKSDEKGKKYIVGKDTGLSDIPKYKPKNNRSKVVKERRKTELPEDKPKNNAPEKLISTVQALLEVLVLRSLKQKVKPKVKSKAAIRVLRSRETPVKKKRILSKEDDRKKKGKDSLDSSSIDEENIKRLLNKLKKKVKKEESDEESVPKKGFSSLHNVTIDNIPSKLGRFIVANFNEQTYILSMDSGDKIEDIRANDIASKLVVAQEIDFLFNINVLTLFTNMMDSTKFDRFPIVRTCPTIKNWSSYLMKQRLELELKDHLLGILELHYEWNEAEGEETEGFMGDSKTYKKEKASLEYHVDGIKFLDLHETDDEDGNFDDDGDRNGDGRMIKIHLGAIRGDLFGQNLVTTEVLNQEPLTPDRMPTRASKVSPSLEKQIVKPSSYMLSPYMDKKTKVVPKITRLESIIGTKKMFARHLKLYGHNRHALVARLKHKIPKLKWSTNENFHDCGIFTMLHMESYNGGTLAN
nr:hypothetical protein [Tanacetum cinerariifolium]GEV84200.1 hypothetical protein [Tanacetum cinerariifolium]